MKIISKTLVVFFFGISLSTLAQKSKEPMKKDTVKQMNLLDEQVKMYGSVFDMAGAGENNPLGGATNYLELINQMALPQESKKIIFDQYKIYDLSLDPRKKDSLKLVVNKMITEAIAKSQSDLDE